LGLFPDPIFKIIPGLSNLFPYSARLLQPWISSDRRSKKEKNEEALQEELYRQIGQLKFACLSRGTLRGMLQNRPIGHGG